jgi:hypothetical protein
MATAQLNSVFSDIRGTSGGFVFRRTRSGTVLARRPESREREASAAQEAQRARFAAAADYARRVLADPWQRRLYKGIASAQNRRVDKLVMSDFLTAPVIEEIDVSGYQGRAGDLLRVIATDDIEVVAVEVFIRTASGTAVENGAAAKVHGLWCYTTTAIAPASDPLVVEVVARDRPGNESRKTTLVSKD